MYHFLGIATIQYLTWTYPSTPQGTSDDFQQLQEKRECGKKIRTTQNGEKEAKKEKSSLPFRNLPPKVRKTNT